MRRGQRAVCQGTVWQCGCIDWPHLRDQRHPVYRNRRLQDERERLWPVGDRRPDHPDSLLGGTLLHWNREREADLLFNAQHGRGARRQPRN